MASWDDEEEDASRPSSPVVFVPPKKQFDDEEGSEEEVLEDWEDDNSDAEREKAAKAQAAKEAEERARKAAEEAKANKLSRTERMQQNNVRHQQEKLAIEEASLDQGEELSPAELRRREKESDLAHADDLFGSLGGPAKAKTAKKATVIDLGSAQSGNATTVDLVDVPLFAPKVKADFANLTAVLTPLLVAAAGKRDYVSFVQDFTKELCRPMTSENVRKVVSTLTAMSNEKMKEEKGPVKKSKAAKTKVALNSGAKNPTSSSAKLQEASYDDGGDDDDDYFM